MTDDEAARRLGVRVREIREARGWTQAALSRATKTPEDRTGINRPNVSRLEGGRYGSLPQTRTLLRLAWALEVQPTDIFGALDEPPTEPKERSNGTKEEANRSPRHGA